MKQKWKAERDTNPRCKTRLRGKRDGRDQGLPRQYSTAELKYSQDENIPNAYWRHKEHNCPCDYGGQTQEALLECKVTQQRDENIKRQ